MRPPRLCLLCGRLPKKGEDAAAACAGCGELPPEVTWQSTQSYRPGQRAGIVVVCALVGLALLAVAALVVREAIRAPSLAEAVVEMALALFVVLAAGLLFWASCYTLLVRTYRFASPDGRTTGDVSTLAGRVRTAFGLHYVLRPIALPASARDLTSARAYAADPSALCERLRAAGPSDDQEAWVGLDDDVTVVLAAILGMAARGEIEVLAGSGRRFWIGLQPEQVKQVEDMIWLRPRAGATHALAFERRLVELLDTHTSARRREASSGPAAYRVGAARDEAPLVQLADLMWRLAMEVDPTDGDVSAHLREMFAMEDVDVYRDEVAAVLIAAAKADSRATRALTLDVIQALEATD
jgi:hypothetical protein